MRGAIHSSLRTAMLFVPGGDAKKLEKIPTLEAKSLLLDLEDGVTESAKPAARALVADALQRFSNQRSLWVRVNALGTVHAYADLCAVVRPGLEGINLPKVERGSDLKTLDWILTQLERERGLPPQSVRVMATLETATPDLEVYSIDEAFLDIAGSVHLFGPPLAIGQAIRSL